MSITNVLAKIKLALDTSANVVFCKSGNFTDPNIYEEELRTKSLEFKFLCEEYIIEYNKEFPLKRRYD